MTKLFVVSIAVIFLSGCTTTQKALDYTCNHKDTVRAAAVKVIETIDTYCPINGAF